MPAKKRMMKKSSTGEKPSSAEYYDEESDLNLMEDTFIDEAGLNFSDVQKFDMPKFDARRALEILKEQRELNRYFLDDYPD